MALPALSCPYALLAVVGRCWLPVGVFRCPYIDVNRSFGGLEERKVARASLSLSLPGPRPARPNKASAERAHWTIQNTNQNAHTQSMCEALFSVNALYSCSHILQNDLKVLSPNLFEAHHTLRNNVPNPVSGSPAPTVPFSCRNFTPDHFQKLDIPLNWGVLILNSLRCLCGKWFSGIECRNSRFASLKRHS